MKSHGSIGKDKEKILKSRMRSMGIRESDIKEKFVRSGGRGGQNVNKVSTCVYLKHIPTGVEVKCSQERYQFLNRFLARRMLVDKIEKIKIGRLSHLQMRIEKIRRQKRRRSRRAKEKILKDKRMRGQLKKERSLKLYDDSI